MVNLGGGFPTKYLRDVPAVESYGRSIFRALRKHFGNRIPETIIEPGRGMVGNAGVIEAEVVLVSNKSEHDHVRWVYLDIGKFGGLAETMDESIRYPIQHAARRRRSRSLRACRSDLQFRRRDVREAPLRPADQPRDRRQGADRRHRRLHGDLRSGGLQRLRAAADLSTSEHAWRAPVAPCAAPPPSGSEARRRRWEKGAGSWSTSGKKKPPTSRRAKLCSTRPTARHVLPRRRSGCAKAACRRDGLSLVAVDCGQIVGTVRLWHVDCRPGRVSLAARSARGSSRSSLPRYRLGAGAPRHRARSPGGPPRDPSDRRRRLLRPLRLYGCTNRRACGCPDSSSAIACWRWNCSPAHSRVRAD